VVGTRAAALFLLFGLIAAACEGRAFESPSSAGDIESVSRHTAAERADAQATIPSRPTTDAVGTDGDDVGVATNLNLATAFGVTNIQAGSVGLTQSIAIGNGGVAGLVVSEQTASVTHISVGAASVSVVSHLSGSSSFSVSSSSTASDGSSVVNLSVTTGSGSVNRTFRFDGAGKFVLRVTAEGDGVPVIQVEEVGP
jgi:hypothetical protein